MSLYGVWTTWQTPQTLIASNQLGQATAAQCSARSHLARGWLQQSDVSIVNAFITFGKVNSHKPIQR